MYVGMCVGVYGRRSERRSFFRGISPPGPACSAPISLDTSIQICRWISRYIDTYMGGCMHGDGSEDPLVPWLHKDCPAGGGGCPHPRPLGSPGEDQGDAFCHRCCMLWHPWMHPWHDGPPQTRADVDGMPRHCGCMRQVHACAPTGGTRSVHVHTMQGQVTHPTVLMHPIYICTYICIWMGVCMDICMCVGV